MFINDVSGTALGTGRSTVQFWPSVMTGCSWSSASTITGVNSSKTVSFTPVVPMLAGSNLQVTLPFWFGSNTSNAGAIGGYTCSGVSVHSS